MRLKFKRLGHAQICAKRENQDVMNTNKTNTACFWDSG
jgi:hypothetical protein